MVANEDIKCTIPIKPIHDLKDLDKVTITHRVNNHDKHEVKILFMEHPDPKVALTTVLQFTDNMVIAKLHLNTPALKFEKFGNCLGGTILDDWEIAKDGKLLTNAGFNQALEEFIATYLNEDDLEQQKTYMQWVKKPYSYSMAQFCTHWHFIRKLMTLYPGAPEVIFTELEEKKYFVDSHPKKHRDEFERAGKCINDMTWPELIRFFRMACKHEDKEKKNAKKMTNADGNGNGKNGKNARTLNQKCLGTGGSGGSDGGGGRLTKKPWMTGRLHPGLSLP